VLTPELRAQEDRLRADLAQRYVRQSTLQLAEISEILGFAEPSVFTRSFRRWHGCTPRDARRAHGGASVAAWLTARAPAAGAGSADAPSVPALSVVLTEVALVAADSPPSSSPPPLDDMTKIATQISSTPTTAAWASGLLFRASLIRSLI